MSALFLLVAALALLIVGSVAVLATRQLSTAQVDALLRRLGMS